MLAVVIPIALTMLGLAFVLTLYRLLRGPGLPDRIIALDTLSNHPNVGPFFARQIIQRLVTSNPSPAYVERVARRFNDNGSGVRGDLQAMWVAILLDNEACGAATLASASHGKLR